MGFRVLQFRALDRFRGRSEYLTFVYLLLEITYVNMFLLSVLSVIDYTLPLWTLQGGTQILGHQAGVINYSPIWTEISFEICAEARGEVQLTCHQRQVAVPYYIFVRWVLKLWFLQRNLGLNWIIFLSVRVRHRIWWHIIVCCLQNSLPSSSSLNHFFAHSNSCFVAFFIA